VLSKTFGLWYFVILVLANESIENLITFCEV
jgi:hypothetical protein